MRFGFIMLAVILVFASVTSVWADSEEEVSLPLPREVVTLYGLEPLNQGQPEMGNRLTVLSLETGKRFSFEANQVTVLGITKTGEKIDYTEYIRSWNGPDPIGHIGQIWAFRDLETDQVLVWIKVLPFYPWW